MEKKRKKWHRRRPDWLRKKNFNSKEIRETKNILQELNLNSICQSASCPNIGECFARKTATFLILGNICTRNCRFCGVENGEPLTVDEREPENLARAVQKLGLEHVVITSVTRDDLPDGGAGQFVRTIEAIRNYNPEVIIEILTPDFNLNREAIKKVVAAGPDIYNHNIETVPRLYPTVRPEADYRRSLDVLSYIKQLDDSIYTKSGIMVGLGEEEGEVREVMQDLVAVDCDIFTIGQYLQPSKEHLPVEEYIRPEQYEKYEELGKELGFKHVFAGPYVRSSFHADDFSAEFI